MSNNPFSLGTYNVTPPTLSDGQTHQVELDVNANLKIASLPAGAAIIGQVEVTDGTNILGTSTHPVRTDPTGGTTQPVSGTVTANAGTGTFATQDAADGSTGSAVPTKATLVGASKSGSLTALALDASGNLNVNVAAGGGSGGTSSTFGAAFPATGTAVGASDGTNMKALLVDGSQNLKVTNTTALVAGTNVIGKVSIDQTTPGTTNLVQDVADGPVTAGTAATKSTLSGGVVATAASAGTTGQQIALQLDSKGNLRVNGVGQTGSFASTTATGAGNTTVTLTVPAATKWRVKSVLAVVATANSGSPRIVILTANDASGNAFAVGIAGVNAPINTPAGSDYTFAPGLPTTTALVSGNATVSFPEVALGPSMSVRLIIVSGVAGDTGTLFANIESYPD